MEIEYFKDFEKPIKNEIINNYQDEFDLKIKKDYIKFDNFPYFTKIHIMLDGTTIDTSVANAIRRTILLYMPTYAFSKNDIIIDNENTFNVDKNNDQLRLTIATLPILNIPHDYNLVNLPETITSDLYAQLEQKENEINNENEKNIKKYNIILYLNVVNNTERTRRITTHDLELKVNNEISNSYKKLDEVLLCHLFPGGSIALRAEASLGISINQSKHKAVYEISSNVAIINEREKPNHQELIYNTKGQISNEEIFSKACIILIKKLSNLKEYINKLYKEKEWNSADIVEIEIYGEEHTLGYLISSFLQRNHLIKMAGYDIPHPSEKRCVIKYIPIKKNKDNLNIIIDTIDLLIRLFKQIKNKFESLKK